MTFSFARKSLASLALLAITACGGGAGSGGAVMPATHGGAHGQAASLTTNIVGVGDSLTAGYQSDGFLGQTNVRNPLFPIRQIPPNQENGWWSLLVEQSSSSSLEDAINRMYDPSNSPLPLIAKPGLDNQIVPSNVPFQPFGQFKGADPCDYDHGFNKLGFTYRGSAQVRMNPNSTTIRDVGVPGLTLHEANTIHEPQTNTCSPLPGIPGLLSDVVNEESGTFWPVLRNFTKLGAHLTDVNAAASVHPTLATVWLGANDVLKYMGSGGRFVGGDRSAGQVKGDLDATVSTLEHAGARVVVANLPNIVETGYFQRVTQLTPSRASSQCKVQSYAYCLFYLASIQSFVKTFAKKYHLDTPNGCIPASVTKPCGYLTLPGVILIIQYVGVYNGQFPNLDCPHPAPHCKAIPGNGLGMNYITPEFAGKVQALNNIVNEGIDEAASASKVPLVNVQAIFHGLVSGNPSNPYYKLAASINPPLCCTLGYIYPKGSLLLPGGILSFDGIHPSNTGYALIAYAFIDTINKAYGAHIPQVDLAAVYNGTRCSTKRYCFPDPYAAH